MKLSDHFSLAELTASDYAIRHQIDNEPSAQAVVNLSALCADVLEPLREKIGAPITITSGYRCQLLNALIGGALRSDHMAGLAADIVVKGLTVDELGAAVRSLSITMPLKQCIREFGAWIHVARLPLSDHADDNVAQFLVGSRDESNRVVYTRWDA
jgi:hypothetical protein